jgi:hypothetical protein
MAATEVIHFPFHAQLEREMTCLADACKQSAVLPASSPSALLDLVRGTAGSVSDSSATGGLGL